MHNMHNGSGRHELRPFGAFKKLLLHDIMIGFGQNKWKFLVSGIAALILCFVFQSQGGILGGSEYSADALSPTVADYLVFMELGMEVYIPSPTNPFEIPIFWLIPPILIALLVSSYPTEDLKDYAINVLCRVRNKKVWWNAKCAWVVLTVIAFYALYFAVSFLYALIGNGAVSWMPNETVENVVNGLSFAHIDAKDLYVAFCVPVAVSVALALCQMLLSFILRPVFGFLIIMVYLMASVYYFSPFLIGDYSMLIRNGFFNPESLDSPMMLIICAGVSCIALAAGNIYFDKTDLIADRKD